MFILSPVSIFVSTPALRAVSIALSTSGLNGSFIATNPLKISSSLLPFNIFPSAVAAASTSAWEIDLKPNPNILIDFAWSFWISERISFLLSSVILTTFPLDTSLTHLSSIISGAPLTKRIFKSPSSITVPIYLFIELNGIWWIIFCSFLAFL